MAKKKVFQISSSLGAGLEETITAAHNYSSELRVDVIPIKKIEVDPENPRDLAISFDDLFNDISESDASYSRKIDEKDSLQSLANSIKEQGIINPIVVYKYGEKYRLVAGERRTLASILAGKSDIQAKILEAKPDELKISLLQWIENVERSDLSLWERLRNLEKIVSVYTSSKGISPSQITVTELSNLIGCSKPYAMNYKAVLAMDDELKNLIINNKIRNLEKAALIADIKSKEIKSHVINACLAGSPLKKLKIIAEQANRNLLKNPNGKKIQPRGRQTVSVNLGITKNKNVAKVIFDSILNNSSMSHLSDHFKHIDWNDFKSVNENFKQLLRKLEELHVEKFL